MRPEEILGVGSLKEGVLPDSRLFLGEIRWVVVSPVSMSNVGRRLGLSRGKCKKFSFRSNEFQLFMDICRENVHCPIKDKQFLQEPREWRYRYKMR